RAKLPARSVRIRAAHLETEPRDGPAIFHPAWDVCLRQPAKQQTRYDEGHEKVLKTEHPDPWQYPPANRWRRPPPSHPGSAVAGYQVSVLPAYFCPYPAGQKIRDYVCPQRPIRALVWLYTVP